MFMLCLLLPVPSMPEVIQNDAHWQWIASRKKIASWQNSFGSLLWMIIDFLFFFFQNFNCRRKWLPPPLRKLSQGKVDKTTAATPSSSSATPNERPFLKKGSEKAFKLAATITAEEEQPLQKTNINRFREKVTVDHQAKSEHDQQQHAHSAEAENEEEVVLPPPMKPIQDSQAIINNGPTAVASSVVEQSPCKRVSIHKQIERTLSSVLVSQNTKKIKNQNTNHSNNFLFLLRWTRWIWWWAKSWHSALYCIFIAAIQFCYHFNLYTLQNAQTFSIFQSFVFFFSFGLSRDLIPFIFNWFVQSKPKLKKINQRIGRTKLKKSFFFSSVSIW